MKIGDVVKLKSGGPEMTVSYLFDAMSSYPGCVNTTWFEGSEIHTGTFHRDSLEKIR